MIQIHPSHAQYVCTFCSGTYLRKKPDWKPLGLKHPIPRQHCTEECYLEFCEAQTNTTDRERRMTAYLKTLDVAITTATDARDELSKKRFALVVSLLKIHFAKPQTKKKNKQPDRNRQHDLSA